jgi:ribosome-associated heat shock protein Hsp15
MRRETGDVRREGAEHRAVRVDKWLWAARFFRSRALAVEAITGGKVAVNAERVKPSREVKAGDELRLRLGPYEHVIIVNDVSERRGPASQAALLYSETAESRAAREKLHWQLKHASPVIERGDARPSKKDRRDLRRLKGT